jgi:hypothetical protein
MKRLGFLKVAISCLALQLTLFVIGCGQSGVQPQLSSASPAPAPAPKPLSVVVSPDSLIIKHGDTWRFGVSVAVIWSVEEGATGGSVSDTGTYTAPPAMGVYHVIATSKADPSKSATATVSVGTTGFTSTGGLTNARYSHAATLLADGKVYIGGGGVDSTTDDYVTVILDHDELFDPVTGTFQPAGKLQRVSHTATLLQNGDVLFTGGVSADDATQATLSASAELLKAGSGTLQPTGSMSIARYGHVATLLQDGKVLITGGHDLHTALQIAEIYDPVSGIFTRVGDMGKPRAGHFAPLLANGKVLISGGGVADVELFDPSTNAFTPAGKTSSAQVGAATLLADGRVLISGEANSDFSGPAPAEVYDPATGKFTPTGTMATLRLAYTTTLLSDGTVLIAGGMIVDRNLRPVVASSEIYNPVTGAFNPGPTMRQPQYQQTATLMPDGSVLLVGGRDSSYAASPSAQVYQ